ncbi:MAG: pyridoxal phosphate-dependent aminotransferase [Acidobacteria bacterium]|nr:pyridoxal phosphate-dependent aminotransferase [Acidobacteriota bacterium]
MFSSRLSFDLTPNRLSAALTRLRGVHIDIDDLTESNPTAVGLVYPPRLLDALSTPASLSYHPQPFGRPAARQAVVDDCRRRGFAVSRDRVVLTASTSEAYALLFKLLCDPGDEVLVPVPSYPLFQYLASLDAVQVRPYALDFHGRWAYDVDAIKQATTPRTRAVVIVSPNTPTGSYLSRYDLGPLAAHCRAHDIAIIGDEVFAEYVLDVELPRVSSVLAQREALTFSLGGLSKSLGLPQLKLGWMVVNGPDALVKASLERLELICDTYLSVSTPVQEALPTLLVEGATIRSQIRDRVTRNYRSVMTLSAARPAVGVLASEGGWYAVMQVPAMQSEESLVLRILEHDHVLVHPGYFFDFPREAFLIVSLLPPPDVFDRAIARVLARVEASE